MLPIRVWNTKTSFSISNPSLPFQCRLTNVVLRRYSNSICTKLSIRCSSSSHNFSNRTHSNSCPLSYSRTCTRKLEIWNSIGMTDSNLNARSNCVDQMLVLYVIPYAHNVLCSVVSQSIRFSFTIFFSIFYNVLFVDSAKPFACR